MTMLIAHSDAVSWLRTLPRRSVLAVVTDPPFGLREFTEGHVPEAASGAWRQPQFGRSTRPRFADLTTAELSAASVFHGAWLREAYEALVPGGHLLLAWHDALMPLWYETLRDLPFESRATIIVQRRGLRGGYRPKGSELQYPHARTGVRACHEPWLLLRRPLPKGWTVARCLDEYGAGALYEDLPGLPAPSVIEGSVPSKSERSIADHACLKSQLLTRRLVAWVVPTPEKRRGLIVDPFAGSGAILAAGLACGLDIHGCDSDPTWAGPSADARVRALAALTGPRHQRTP